MPNFLQVFLGPIFCLHPFPGSLAFSCLYKLVGLDAVHVQCKQGFCAPGVSISVAFLEKNIKVFSCTGGLSIHFKPLFQNNNKVVSALWVSFFSISIFLVLNDHKYICIFVQNLIQSQPSIQQQAQHPLGQISIVFGSSVLIQSARFPLMVNRFSAVLLYVSARGSFFKIVSFWIGRGSRYNLWEVRDNFSINSKQIRCLY